MTQFNKSAESRLGYIPFRINKTFANSFDVLQNVDVTNRKSDVGFLEEDKLMIRGRSGTTRVGNNISATIGGSRQIFYTDFLGVSRHFVGMNNRVYWNNAGTWTDIGVAFTGNDFNFRVYRLPRGGGATEFTTPSPGTGPEKVQRDASDAPGDQNIGKFLFITQDGTDNTYQGAWGQIASFSAGEYTLTGSGIIVPVKAGARYRIYDTIGPILQIVNGVDNDQYVDQTTVVTAYAGLCTASLRKVKAIESTEFVRETISFNNSIWAYKNFTLFYSGGLVNNPFFFTFSGVLTLPGVDGTIVEMNLFR